MSDMLDAATELLKHQNVLIQERARAGVKMRGQRIDERKNSVNAYKDITGDLLDTREAFQKAREGDRDSMRDLSGLLRSTAMRIQPRLAELGYSADLKMLTGFEGRWEGGGARQGWTAAINTFGEGSEHPDVILPQTVNQMLKETFPVARPDIRTSREELDKMFRERGFDDPGERDKILALIDRAENISRGVDAAEASVEKLLGYGKELDRMMQAPGATDEQLQALVARVEEELADSFEQVKYIFNADPQVIEDRIALDSDSDMLSALDVQIAQNKERLDKVLDELGEDPATLQDDKLVNWLEDPFTQEWARTNGFNLGYVNRDEATGRVKGVQLGNDFYQAVTVWNRQSRNPEKWGRMLKPYGGQFTQQIVEVKPQPAMVGVSDDEQLYVRFGDAHYVRQDNGSFQRVTKEKTPGGIQWQPAAKQGRDGFEILTASDLKQPDADKIVTVPSEGEELQQVNDLYDTPVRGVREALNAGQAETHGKGYVAVVTPDGERVVVPHGRVRILEDMSPPVDKAERRAARAAVRGLFPQHQGADPQRDFDPERDVHGTQIFEGDAGDTTDPETQRLRDFVKEKQTGELPLDSLVDDESDGPLRKMKDWFKGRRKGPETDVVRRRAAEKVGIRLDDIPEQVEPPGRGGTSPARRPTAQPTRSSEQPEDVAAGSVAPDVTPRGSLEDPEVAFGSAKKKALQRIEALKAAKKGDALDAFDAAELTTPGDESLPATREGTDRAGRGDASVRLDKAKTKPDLIELE